MTLSGWVFLDGHLLFLVSCLAFGTKRFISLYFHVMGERCSFGTVQRLVFSCHSSEATSVPIESDRHFAQPPCPVDLRYMPGAQIFIKKERINSQIPWAGLQTSFVRAIHPPPPKLTHPSLHRIFEAGLHDSVRDIYEVCHVQLTFLKILTHK